MCTCTFLFKNLVFLQTASKSSIDLLEGPLPGYNIIWSLPLSPRLESSQKLQMEATKNTTRQTMWTLPA